MDLTFRVPSQNTKNLLEEACQKYEADLPGSVAEKYLSNRGITSEARKFFRLGFVSGESLFPGHEFWTGRLVIPYITPTGIVQMKARAIPDNGEINGPQTGEKYLYETGSQTTIFNTRDLWYNDGVLAVCEGEFDAITAHMAGIPAVGIPGAKNWKKNGKVFRRVFRYRKIIILADNDDHGEGLDFAKAVQADVRGSRIILMDPGYDVNSFVVEHGVEALRKKVGLDE